MVRTQKVFILKESQPQISHKTLQRNLSVSKRGNNCHLPERENREQYIAMPLHFEKGMIYCISSSRDEKLLNCHEYSC